MAHLPRKALLASIILVAHDRPDENVGSMACAPLRTRERVCGKAVEDHFANVDKMPPRTRMRPCIGCIAYMQRLGCGYNASESAYFAV